MGSCLWEAAVVSEGKQASGPRRQVPWCLTSQHSTPHTELSHLSPITKGTVQAWVLGSHLFFWTKLHLKAAVPHASVVECLGSGDAQEWDIHRFLTPRTVGIQTMAFFLRCCWAVILGSGAWEV